MNLFLWLIKSSSIYCLSNQIHNKESKDKRSGWCQSTDQDYSFDAYHKDMCLWTFGIKKCKCFLFTIVMLINDMDISSAMAVGRMIGRRWWSLGIQSWSIVSRPTFRSFKYAFIRSVTAQGCFSFLRFCFSLFNISNNQSDDEEE